ncbi:hypothetical protein BC835DRAFT_1294494, partial [Cytidiella melzeri]
VGDFYRGCQHFHGRYYTGKVVDCMSPTCKTSAHHRHKTSRHCLCIAVSTELRRVQNLIHTPFEGCAYARY